MTRQPRKCCFERQTGRITKGPTRHSFFFYSSVTAQEFYLANKESCSLQVWGQADSNGEASRVLAASFCSFLSPPQWACPMQIRASQGRGTVFHLTSQLLRSTCGFFKSEISLKLQFTVWIECDSQHVPQGQQCLFVQIYLTCLAHTWHPISVTAWSYSFCKFLNPNKFWP